MTKHTDSLMEWYLKNGANTIGGQSERLKQEGWRQCAKGQRTTQFCGQMEDAVAKAVLAEREACARICDGFVERRQSTEFGRMIAEEIRARGAQ